MSEAVGYAVKRADKNPEFSVSTPAIAKSLFQGQTKARSWILYLLKK
jgi:hypothetical protein